MLNGRDCRCGDDIVKRINLGRNVVTRLMPLFKSHDLILATKVKLFESVVFPVTTYAAETWTLTKKDHKRIDSFEIWCY